MEDFMDQFKRRAEHCARFGYVVASDELVAALKPCCVGTVVEVMSGTGHLAAALRKAGVTLRATDNFSWHKKEGWKTYTQVDRVDCAEAALGADTVIMVWPYMDEDAHRTAVAMKPGASLLYCGEGDGGCTASASFFELMQIWRHDEAFDKVNAHHHRWVGLHDYWSRFIKP